MESSPIPAPAEPNRRGRLEGTPGATASQLTRVFRTGLRRRATVALENVTLTFESGAITGIFGPNGSGKSTLLRLLAGTESPTSGRVRALGGEPTDKSVRARTAYLPDVNALPEELTGRAALRLVARLAGVPRAQVRASCDAMLERVGLADAARSQLRTYSRGMQRRFGFAHTFIAAPALILLDEPTAGLDAAGFPIFRQLAREAKDRGATIVLASHLASDLIESCDALALLVDGHVVTSGALAELTEDRSRWELTVSGPSLEADRDADAADCVEDSLSAIASALDALGLTLHSSRPVTRSLREIYEQAQASARPR